MRRNKGMRRLRSRRKAIAAQPKPQVVVATFRPSILVLHKDGRIRVWHYQPTRNVYRQNAVTRVV